MVDERHNELGVNKNGGFSDGMSMTEEDEDDEKWEPGDGVCPSISQFNGARDAAYYCWYLAPASEFNKVFSKASYIEAFLELLKDVPAYYQNPPENLDLIAQRKSPLTLRSLLRLNTTDDQSCDNPQKDIPYIQCLGFPAPMTYRVADEKRDACSGSIGISFDKTRKITSIASAWSYILSCRWVEILQNAGEQSSLRVHQPENVPGNFWDLVLGSQWTAQLNKGKCVFYAPWMMREEGFEKENIGRMAQILPNSSTAFDILIEFCASEGLMNECVVALITVLRLPSINVLPPTLPPPLKISRPVVLSKPRDLTAERLYESIDQCMCLGSTRDALDSLLCSVFFDPRVPCNLVGAASTGIREAVLQCGSDYSQLITAISKRHPQLALPWAAAVCSRQTVTLLTMALEGLPPICLVTAFWTKTRQSFLQVEYTSGGTTTQPLLSRSSEFSTSYYCRPDVSIPWSPAPPFGSTSKPLLSLDVANHYSHHHIPRRWRTYWILRSGDSVASSSEVFIERPAVYSLLEWHGISEEKKNLDPSISLHEQRIADDQSASATSRLFNWHRANGDGLWLDDGTLRQVEVIRKLQQHPWIIDPFDDGGKSEPCDEENPTPMDPNSVMEWLATI